MSEDHTERRRYQRFPGDHYPLLLGRHPAQVIDWSVKGAGVRLREPAEDLNDGDNVALGIHSEKTLAVMVIQGLIHRIDHETGVVHIEFLDASEDAIRFLAESLSAKPHVVSPVEAEDATTGESGDGGHDAGPRKDP
ncbi:PilZ domain-containing protein [Skermanella stibiiresistens]|nr:PilZ domain-containing protein [Skermanella stibiiresistens]